jgi:hypothetical protein
MPRWFIAFCLSAASLIAVATPARAETIARYECSVYGATAQEPIADRAGHMLVSFQYSCFAVDGMMKGAVSTAISISEWDGPKGTYLAAAGVHRIAGGLAVIELVEGTGSIIMRDGKPVGPDGAGKSVVKHASGTLASLAGKTVNFASKPLGSGRFEILFTD